MLYRCKHRPDGHELRCAVPSCPNGVTAAIYRVYVTGPKGGLRVRLRRSVDPAAPGGFTWKPAR